MSIWICASIRSSRLAVQVEGLELRRRFRIACHKDKFLTPLIRSFLDLCRSYELDDPLPAYNGLY